MPPQCPQSVGAHHPQFASVLLRDLPSAKRDEMADAGVTIADKEAGWLETYDPKEKAIVMIVRGGGGEISSYLIGSRPSPPDAYLASKAEEN